MKEIGSYEARTKFSQILGAVSSGKKFLITIHRKPVAKLVPARVSSARDVSEIVEDLLAFHTRTNCSDVSLEDLHAAIIAGRR